MIPVQNVLRMLDIISELHGGDVVGHANRTAVLAMRLGYALGLDDQAMEWLRVAAHLHDIGKVVGIPDVILNKGGGLNEAENLAVQFHVAQGCRIIAPLELGGDVMRGLLHHHERWDGGGYPQGLIGKDIPLLARIVCVVDVYDALTHERPYHNALNDRQAIRVMKNDTGHFDPEIFQAFCRIDRKVKP